MSKQHHMIAVSITRHLLDSTDATKPDAVYCSYCRTMNGKAKATASLGLGSDSEAVTRACLIVRCERSQNTGFANSRYEREIELYGVYGTDLDVLRGIEAECQGMLLGPATEDWRTVDNFIINHLGECIYGANYTIVECSSSSHT